MKSHYAKKVIDFHSKNANRTSAPREPMRPLAEFGREVGVSAIALAAHKGGFSDFPPTLLQSGKVGYYSHAALKAWWALHKVPS